MMPVLTVEARTILLAGMPAAQRWRIMEEMRDEERAEVVVAMGLDLRKDAAAALSPRVWERTLDAIKNSGNNAAR
jgi:Mg/Co/Ni transporter MgtE